MAKRKRRRGNKARSSRKATRSWLSLGDTVRVKDEVMDPDYDEHCIGGWSGEIVEFESSEGKALALIEWDETTQRERMDKTLRRRVLRQGLSVDQMWLLLSDLERVDVAKGCQRSQVAHRGPEVEEPEPQWTPPSCGHTYPDVLRLRDEVRPDGTYVRITDCRYCGRAEIPFPKSILAAQYRRELEATGYSPGIDEDEIESARERAERQLRMRSRGSRWWQRLWWR